MGTIIISYFRRYVRKLTILRCVPVNTYDTHSPKTHPRARPQDQVPDGITLDPRAGNRCETSGCRCEWSNIRCHNFFSDGEFESEPGMGLSNVNKIFHFDLSAILI